MNSSTTPEFSPSATSGSEAGGDLTRMIARLPDDFVDDGNCCAGKLKPQVRPYEETLSAGSVVAEHFGLAKPASSPAGGWPSSGGMNADWVALVLAEDARVEDGKLANGPYLAVKIAEAADLPSEVGRLRTALANIRDHTRETSTATMAIGALSGSPSSSPAGGDVREAFETCAAICEARAEYFDRAPSYREWTDAARSYRATAKEIRERAALSPATSAAEPVAFQQRVQPWMMACFGAEISADVAERNHRFLEEALELVQSTGCTASEAHQLVDYVYGRDIGETHQEIGGVMVTLAALCLALSQDMHAAGETELARIWTKVEKIRAKQAAKPKHSPLPQHVATPPAPAAVDGQRVKALEWTHLDNGSAWAHTRFGISYHVRPDGSWCERNGEFVSAGGALGEAKAAAQADYEARIRACLATDKEGA